VVKPAFRTKSLGTKVTPNECAQLEALASARGLTMSEWVREVLLDQTSETVATPAEETILAEARGGPIKPDGPLKPAFLA